MSNTVVCQLCGTACPKHLYEHLNRAHKLSAQDYQAKYPGAPLVAPAIMERLAQNGAIVRQPVQKLEEIHILDSCLTKRPGTSPLVPAVDDHYLFPSETNHFIQALNHDERCLLVGPTGSGKSSLVMQVAARANFPLRRVNLNGETTVSDFVGRWVVRGKEMVFQYGVLPTAMREGQLLLLDELDTAQPQILFVLQGILEPHGKLVLLDKDGEVVEPHPEFRIVATANTLGRGDESGLYTGREVLCEAFLDRFTTVIQLDYPDAKAETKIVQQKTPQLAKKVVQKLVKVAGLVRKAITREEVYCTFSTRRLLAFAAKYAQLGDLTAAAELTVLNKLSEDDRRVVEQVIHANLGDQQTNATAKSDPQEAQS